MLYFWKKDKNTQKPTMIKKIVLLLVIALSVNSCTRDDICTEETPTTPFLIITFKNFNNPLFSKSVESLTVTTIVDNDSIDVVKFIKTDSIAIPLRTGFDFTDYLFVENDQDEEPGNTDKVTFSYQRENIYINRACAFKAIYTQLSANRESDNNNWIQEIVINEFIVENENKTHVTIFH